MTTEVEITGWTAGFDAARCTQLLQSAAGLSATEARRVTERVLRGEHPAVALRSADDARLVVSALARLGAIASSRAG